MPVDCGSVPSGSARGGMYAESYAGSDSGSSSEDALNADGSRVKRTSAGGGASCMGGFGGLGAEGSEEASKRGRECIPLGPPSRKGRRRRRRRWRRRKRSPPRLQANCRPTPPACLPSRSRCQRTTVRRCVCTVSPAVIRTKYVPEARRPVGSCASWRPASTVLRWSIVTWRPSRS